MSQPIAELYTDANFFSPYAMSAFITLTEKGIPFTLKPVPHSQLKCNKVTHWSDPDNITVLALLETPLHAGKTSDSERAVLHRKTS